MRVVVLPTPDEVARASGEYLQGPRIAISGGSTAEILYRAWLPQLQQRMKAGKAFRFFPVDERKVPFEDAQCNWRACDAALLQPAGIGDQRAHYVTSAAEYQAVLDREFQGEPVVFDQIFLGMGEDGHTASLFPGQEALRDRKSLVLDIVGPKPPPRRVTLGLKPLWECKTLIAVVLGSGKAEMVKRLRQGDMDLPITLAMAGHGDAVLLLDRAAAGEV